MVTGGPGREITPDDSADFGQVASLPRTSIREQARQYGGPVG